MNSNYEMATPISNLQAPQKTNVNNLVKTVETNIDTLNRPMPLQIPKDPYQYNPNIELTPLSNNMVTQQPVVEAAKPEPVKVEKPEEKKSLANTFQCNFKELIIVILLFSLLAHKKINKLFLFNLPFLSTINSPLPSLFFRGFLFAILLFLIKHFI